MSIVTEWTEISYALPDIYVRCSGVEALRLDARDRHGIEFSGERGAPRISIGVGGYVVGPEIRFWVDHRAWPRGETGQLAPTERSRWPGPMLRGAALEAADLLRAALLLTRSVWALSETHLVPVRSFARVFSGAGSDVLAAGSAVRREAAFRGLVARWRAAGGDELAPWFDDPMGYPFSESDEEPAAAAELMIAGFEQQYRSRVATLVHASPGEPWTLRRTAAEDPAQFFVDRAAFDCSRGEADRTGLVRLER
ncbi:hypothetical protein ACFV9C_09430 [Kribbella sp. NPDC059898]|uniref:hypothetical protein n=1 Tax=Kribbella sp. NPDC059898 TaxID=3346995 RepID=UPI0036496544